MLAKRQKQSHRWMAPIVVLGVIGLVTVLLVTKSSTEEATESDQSNRGISETTSTPPTNKEFPKAPRFTLKDYAGTDVSLADFAGTPVVLNSWATWCPFCREELPDFADVAEEFAGEVVVISINRGESRQTSKEYTDAFQVTDRITFLLDPSDAFYEAVGGISMPETLFLDRDGRVRYHARGPLQKDEFRRQVELLIKEG